MGPWQLSYKIIKGNLISASHPVVLEIISKISLVKNIFIAFYSQKSLYFEM